jgi:hypothetical protein
MTSPDRCGPARNSVSVLQASLNADLDAAR